MRKIEKKAGLQSCLLEFAYVRKNSSEPQCFTPYSAGYGCKSAAL